MTNPAGEQFDEIEPDEVGDTVHCDLCGAPWDLVLGDGIVLNAQSQNTLYGLPAQIKLCVDCAIQAAKATELMMHETDRCEHGVTVGDWCEPCNKAYKEARIENGLTD